MAPPQAHAYIHPCIPATKADLDYIKANLTRQPWKNGYAQLLASGNLNWVAQPAAIVTRAPDLNLIAWSKDMGAVWDMARLWYFTGNYAYGQKAHDILLAWAKMQTSFGGQEAGLALGDGAIAYAGGASILRGTWPGWTAADTTAVKNLFKNVYWPVTAASFNVPGPGSKGCTNLAAGMAIAVFCDDTTMFNHVLDIYRSYPGSGLPNTLPTGQMGESGRDAGHAYLELFSKAFIAEIAWKQGIDLFSEMDNRLLAVGEYYARNTLALDNPYVPYGSVDYTYYSNAAGPYAANRSGLLILQNAYKNRRGIPTPWVDRKLDQQGGDSTNFMFARSADFSAATPPAPVVRPPVSLASNGLTLTTLGDNSAGRSASYSKGTWTVTGLGNDVWNDVNDDCQFLYKAMNGDCAMVARVTSAQPVTASVKAGLMIRDNLSATVSERASIAILPTTGTNTVQCRQWGWTENWAGTGWCNRSDAFPSGMPCWLKIERRGNLVTTYTSPDGTSWAPNISSYYAKLPSTVFIGLFTCSGGPTPTTATFDHVACTGGSGGLVTAPAAPAALFADGSLKAITVRWLPSFGAAAYDLLRSTTSGGGYTLIATNLSPVTTSFVDSTVAAGKTYYYVVRAKNSAGISGISPQFGDSLLPAPMVNLALSGTATDSAHIDGQDAPNAFDTDPGTKWFNNNVATTGWIQYDFGSGNAQVVKRYTITSADDVPGRDPKTWNFLGSQDGSSWTTLDSQGNQTFANRYQVNTYNIGNTTAYRYYRLNITANNGEAGVQLSELGLWSTSGKPSSAAPTVSSSTATATNPWRH